MRKYVCNHEYRLIRILSHADIHSGSVLPYDDTVDGKRNRYPLILLDSSVIVSVKICKSRILIQRILLYIDTRRVNVCSENVHAVLDWISSDVIESQCLLVVYCIHFVSCTKLSALCDHAIDVSVSGSFSH